MLNDIQKKRVKQYHRFFLLSCLSSIFGLLFYVYGRYKVPFPLQWISNKKQNFWLEDSKLFCFGTSISLQVNFILGFFFMLFSREKIDQNRFKKIKFWLSKILSISFSLIFGIGKFGSVINKSYLDFFLFCFLVIIINCCLLEIIIQLMDQYGICNSFNLILFTEFLPFDWFKGEWNNNKFLQLFGLFLITIFFVFISNLKWEVPIDTNSLYIQENNFSKENYSKLGFKLNFSFIPLIYLSQFVSLIFSIFLISKKTTSWFSYSSIVENWRETSFQKMLYSKKSWESREEANKNGFWTIFFAFNENKSLFVLKDIKKWFFNKNWIVIFTFFFFIFTRWLATWMQMRYSQWRVKDISKELRERGIYIDSVSSGLDTEKLLKKIINKLVLFWNIFILIFNLIFDSLFPTSLIFSNWLSGVNIGIDLISQIITKYQYIRINK